MENTAEVTRLMTVLDNINGSISQNQIDISNMQAEISDIKKTDMDLKRIYPDLCQLEQIEIDIQNQQVALSNYDADDQESREVFEDNIKDLQARSVSIAKMLNDEMGISNRKDYDELIGNIKQKKDLIPDMEAKINQKDQENVELMERKNTIEKKLEELSKTKQEEEKQPLQRTKIDLTKQTQFKANSELAAFIDYDTNDEEEVKPQYVTNKVDIKKEDEIEDVIGKIVKKQNNVLKKFQEIIEESNDTQLKDVMQQLKEKFERGVYQDIQDITYKMLQKRKEIDDLEKQIKETTPEMEKQRLEGLNIELTNSIQQIDDSQQKFEGEIKYNFNDLKTYATNEFNYIKTLQQRIVEQSKEINDKINNIEEKLGQIMLNSEESILETIAKVEKELNAKYQDVQKLEDDAKQTIISILETSKQEINQSSSYETFMQTMDDVKEKIIQQQQEITDEKTLLDKDIQELKQRKAELDERYNRKKEENKDKDKEEEVLLLDTKRLLKEESQKVIDMVNILTDKQQAFVTKINQAKQDIKSKIREKDDVIVKQKNELINKVNEGKKALSIKLKEDIEEYNRRYIAEFDNLMKNSSNRIDEIERENKDYKTKTQNIVVLSEFDENSQLLDELKDLLGKGVLAKKDIENVENPTVDLPKSGIENEIEQNMRYIKPEDTIDSKIDFSDIYEMENEIVDVEEIKQNIYNICARLNMEYEIKQKEEVKEEVKEVKNIENIEKIVQKDLEQDREKNKRRVSMLGIEDYSLDVQEILKDIPWEQLVELKNMNKLYKRTLYIDDLKQLKEEKVASISNLKQEYKQAVAQAKKLYEIKKYVLAYKKGMEELAKGSNSEDKDAQKQYANSMKVASKSLKIMKENGISSFEDFRYQVLKNSEQVKQILAETKAQNEELVKLTGLIQAIEKPNELSKPDDIQKEM